MSTPLNTSGQPGWPQPAASGLTEPAETEAAAEAPPPAPELEPAPGQETAGVAFGQPAADGQFTFTVAGLECGATTLGENEYLREEAQGQFCQLRMRIDNTGDTAATLFADNQYLIDGDTRYSASFAATYAADPGGGFSTEINPGNGVNGVVVFDVPPGVRPTTAELHDSAFSGGVEVLLAGA